MSPAQQQTNRFYQLVHFVGMNRGQFAVILGKDGSHAPVNRDIDLLFRFLLGNENELRAANFGYHVFAYS